MTALTAGGCVLSTVALCLGLGLPLDRKGFAVNILADLALIGPGLLITNVVVKRIQATRTKYQLEYLVRAVLLMLHDTVQTTQQALDMLGVHTSLDVPSRQFELVTTHRVRSALTSARAAIPPSEQRKSFPSVLELQIGNPLRFPNFGVVLRMIRQMDAQHPMPRAVTSANIADDWTERCGVDFIYGWQPPPTGGGIVERWIGLTQVTEKSAEAVVAGTVVRTASYMTVVERCLVHAEAIIKMLTEELPAGVGEQSVPRPSAVESPDNPEP